MEKKLKRSYRFLDLPFNATEEDVEARKNALNKILISKGQEKNKSYEKQIQDVNDSANLILLNIKNNGIPNEKPHCFESSNESIIVLIIIAFFAGLACFYSFFLLF